MSDHDRFCLIGKGIFQHGSIHVVLWNGHINKYRNRTILNDRRNRCRESGSYGDHFVSRHNTTVSHQRRSKRHKRKQVCGRTGVYQRTVFNSKVLRKFLFKLIGISSGSKPELKGTVYQIYHLFMSIITGSIWDTVAFFKRFFLIVVFVTILFYHLQNTFSCLFFILIFKHNINPF